MRLRGAGRRSTVTRPKPPSRVDSWLAATLTFSMASLLSRITIDPEVCHGKPVVRGLRYSVESLLEYLAADDSIEDLLVEFPDLEREDFLACLTLAVGSIVRDVPTEA